MLMNKLPDTGCFYEWNNDVALKLDRKTRSIMLNQKVIPQKGSVCSL